MRTFTKTDMWYSFGRDRTLLPEERMAILGHGHCRDHNLTEKDMQSLVGEAMAAPNLAVVLYSVIVGADLPKFWSARV